MEIYCGNNSTHSQVINGNKVLGTKYSCLQKGIGNGLNSEYDSSYLEPYNPIDDRKMYCGNSNILPQGYDMMGNLPKCLQLGMGIGKRLRAERGPINILWKLAYWVFCIFMIVVFSLVLYKTKPKFIQNEKEEIDNKSYYLVSSIFSVLLILLFWYFYRYYISLLNRDSN